MDPASERVKGLLGEVKALAQEYYRLTGRPLGVTGEIAEYEAAELLGLELAAVRQPGYDAIRREPANQATLLQIKGRPYAGGRGHRPARRKIEVEGKWDAVLLVLLDDPFEATAIYEAERGAVLDAIQAPGSRARAEGATWSRALQATWPSRLVAPDCLGGHQRARRHLCDIADD